MIKIWNTQGFYGLINDIAAENVVIIVFSTAMVLADVIMINGKR